MTATIRWYHRPTLSLLLLLLGACSCACKNDTLEEIKLPEPMHAVLDARWTVPGDYCDRGSCATMTTSPRSLWPFFRDLDLLRLLEKAAGVPRPSEPSLAQCQADIKRYLEGLNNFTTTAVQMWDASVRSPRGAVWGELWQMGNFDACMDAGAHPEATLDLPGTAYCLTTLKLVASKPDHELLGSAWDFIKPPQRRLQIARHRSRWGMCLPSSCGPREVPALLGAPLKALAVPHGLDATLHVEPALWQSSEQLQLQQQQQDNGSDQWAIFIWLLTWVAFCSIADSAGKSGRLLEAFSLRRNWRELMSVEKGTSMEEKDDIAVIHVAKVVGVLLVILGHRSEALMAVPLVNGNDIEKLYLDPVSVFLLNGSVIVDIFFTAAGSLLTWTILGYTQRAKKLSVSLIYAYRYLRLVPAYAAVIAFLALRLPSLGSGPLWNTIVAKEALRCQQRWWTNLLFINNFVHQDQPCLDPGWYLACDTQLFLMAVPLVMMMHSRPRRAALLLGLAIVVGVLYPAIVTWKLGLDGTIVAEPDALGRMAETPIHMYVYVSPLGRVGPYFLGLAAGWYLRHVRLNAKSVHRALYWAFPLLVLLTLVVVAMGVLFYPSLVATTPRWVHVAYAGLHRTLCALSYACGLIVIASFEWKGESSWSRFLAGFRPWSRLSYCAFLTHVLFQMYSIGQQRSPATYNTMNAITLSLSDAVFAFAAALVLHLTLEAPCNALLLALRSRRRSGAPAPALKATTAES